MEDRKDRKLSAAEFGTSLWGRIFLGALPILAGVLAILVSLNVVPYVDLRPNRMAIFNDPHTWEVFALGVMLTTFGLASIIPPGQRILGQLNKWLLLFSFLAVVTGVVLKKLF